MDLYRLAVANVACHAIQNSRHARFTLTVKPDSRVLVFENGGGDSALVAFCGAGILFKGFDHASRVSPWAKNRVADGVYDALPTGLHRFVLDPATAGDPESEELFPAVVGGNEAEVAAVTFAAWWSGGRWQHGNTAPVADMAGDGSGWLIGAVVEGTNHYVEDDAYSFDPAVVAKIAAHQPLSDADIRKLDAKADVAAVRQRLEAIGYGKPAPFALG